MIRDTSIEAYQKIKANGLLKRTLLDVYETFYKHGPLTSMEANVIYCMENEAVNNLNQFRATITQLCDRKVMQPGETVICETTGMRVHLWDVTSGLPEKVKKLTKKEKKTAILGLIEDLARECTEPQKHKLRLIYHKVQTL